MKIVDIGICVNNRDPKGIQRIRVVSYDDYISAKENYVNYDKWDESDAFVASPFLPTNINYIPEVGQAVKIIRYDTDKVTINQEYLAGPFTTSHDLRGQTFSQQLSSTSYGVNVKGRADIVNKFGELPPDCEGMLTKPKDFSVGGKYGSDAIFTEGGVVLRGGKLISKESATTGERRRLTEYPVRAKKLAKLQLKKFPHKETTIKVKTEVSKTPTRLLKFIVDYTVDDLTNPTKIDFFIYRTNPVTDLFQSNNFTEYTNTSESDLTIINDNGSGSTPTYTVTMTGDTRFDNGSTTRKASLVSSAIRTAISEMFTNGFRNLPFTKETIDLHFTSINVATTDTQLSDIHPFYFRPTSEFRERGGTVSEVSTKETIINNITPGGNSGPKGDGLVYTNSKYSPTPTVTTETRNKIKRDPSGREQTFGAVTSDKIYLLSTDEPSSKNVRSIDFEKLNQYEYTQEDYLKEIEPNTFSLVRGEILIKFLRAMYDVLTSHVHNINKPYAKAEYNPHKVLQELYNDLESELINKSIKTN